MSGAAMLNDDGLVLASDVCVSGSNVADANGVNDVFDVVMLFYELETGAWPLTRGFAADKMIELSLRLGPTRFCVDKKVCFLPLGCRFEFFYVTDYCDV